MVPILAGISIISAFHACTVHDTQKENTVNPVHVVTALPTTVNASNNEVSGKVEASQTAGISTRIMGYITHINVKVGDQVKQGQLLATIESEDIQAKKAQAEALLAEAETALSIAKKDYDRFTQLYNQQSASAKELENMSLQYNTAKARTEAARQIRNEAMAMLSYTGLKAPFSGIITQKMADAGSMASPGMPILTLEQNKGFRITAVVPETEIGKIHTGMDVLVTIKSTGKSFKAKVNEMSASSLSTGGQYLIRINVPEKENQGLYSGQYANVLFSTKGVNAKTTESTMLVPVSGIVHRDQLTGLYTISENHTAVLRWVRLGKSYGNNIEVLSGLAPNEKFIVHANGKLYNGVSVTEN